MLNLKKLYSKEWLIEKVEQSDRLKYLFFWGDQPEPGQTYIGNECLSQWYSAPFDYEGNRYPTTEHLMMAEKARLCDDEKALQRILKSEHPREAKQIGREILGFDQELWEQKRLSIVEKGNQLKFAQSKELKSFLINTKQRILVEASPLDEIWGIGLSSDHPHVRQPNLWPGQNLLGFVLMRVRDHLTEV